jgi:hypothetical protein
MHRVNGSSFHFATWLEGKAAVDVSFAKAFGAQGVER